MPFARRQLIITFGLISFSCLPVRGFELLPSVWATADSCGMVNGVSYTDGNPQLSLNGQVQINKNVSFGGQVHTSQPDGIQQRHRGFSVYGAYDKAINNQWLIGSSLARREFIGGAQNWDYSHANAYAKHVSGFAFKYMYSPRYYGTRFNAKQSTVEYQKKLSSHVYYRASVNQFDLNSELHYQHAQLVLGANISRLNIEAGYYWVSDTLAPTPIGLIAPPKWQLRLLYFLY